MGATFDVDLLYRIGQLLGDEGIRKRVHVALAPTVCIQRSPLIGRGFEAFAEDPILSGTLAANYVNGIQDRNVGACIKHYMAHDQSTKATEDDVHMTHRTLREIHLMPFQVAMTKSKPWAIMTAYQMVNGLHVSEDPFLIQQVLRHEWKFDGLVMSDWWGTYSTSEAINAGLDLEMPGPSIWRGKQLMAAVECLLLLQRECKTHQISLYGRTPLYVYNWILRPCSNAYYIMGLLLRGRAGFHIQEGRRTSMTSVTSPKFELRKSEVFDHSSSNYLS
ncbi:beta-glucosidase precursor BGLUC [Ilyonectria robusta]